MSNQRNQSNNNSQRSNRNNQSRNRNSNRNQNQSNRTRAQSPPPGDGVPILISGPNNNFSRFHSKIFPIAQTEYGRAADFLETSGAPDYVLPDPVAYADWDKPFEDTAQNRGANQSAYNSNVLAAHAKRRTAYEDTRVKLYGYIISKLSFGALDKV